MSKETTPIKPNSNSRYMKNVNKLTYIGILCFSAILLLNSCKDKDDLGFDSDLVEATRTPEWVAPNEVEYEYNMTYTSQVAFDGVISNNINTKIGAFIGDECRGTATLAHEAELDVYVFNLTIYSNEPAGEEVVIKVYNQEKGWLYKRPAVFEFGSDEAEGDIDNVLNCLSYPATAN